MKPEKKTRGICGYDEMEGRRITKKKALKGLGDPTKWDEENERILKDFFKRRSVQKIIDSTK
jgi:hypothetical protein